ncbi:MAG: transporter substrate-binding domain-containing protein [Anaerolineae bacterium]|nr:transporter substrate-binding domain-containing protein [Anaerolineae bacterium]
MALAGCQLPGSLPAESSPEPATPITIPTIPPGDGSDQLDHLLESGAIRVGVRVWPEAEFSPPVFRDIAYTEAGGALTGFEVEIARLVAAGLGLELTLIEADPQRLETGDWADEWDIAIASLTPVDQPLPGTPAQAMVYSIPYGFMPIGLLVPKAEDPINDLSLLSGKKVGVWENSIHQRLLTPEGATLTVQGQPFMAPLPDGIQPVNLSNLQKSIRQLGQLPAGQDQLAAILGPAPLFEQAVDQDLAVQLALPRVGMQPLSIAVIPHDDLTTIRLIGEINKILARLQEQGVLAEIYQRWYGKDLSQVR